MIATKLAEAGNTMAVVLAGLVGMGILAVYATRRAVPLKYLVPGLLLMILFQLWPVVYTASLSFTNYGDGHLYSKEESVTDIIAQSVREVPDTPRYKMSVAIAEGGDPATADLVLLLTKPDGSMYVGDKKGLQSLPATGVEKTPIGKITKAPGYTILNARAGQRPQQGPLGHRGPDQRRWWHQAGRPLRGLRGQAHRHLRRGRRQAHRHVHDATDGVRAEGRPLGQRRRPRPVASRRAGRRASGSPTTRASSPTRRSADGFVSIFLWNLVFAIVSVLSTFLLGMLIALLFNDPRLRGKGIYRSLLILPYALPIFVTALVWKGMFNQDYGIINQTTRPQRRLARNERRGQDGHPHHEPVARLPLHVHRLHRRAPVDPAGRA